MHTRGGDGRMCIDTPSWRNLARYGVTISSIVRRVNSKNLYFLALPLEVRVDHLVATRSGRFFSVTSLGFPKWLMCHNYKHHKISAIYKITNTKFAALLWLVLHQRVMGCDPAYSGSRDPYFSLVVYLPRGNIVSIGTNGAQSCPMLHRYFWISWQVPSNQLYTAAISSILSFYDNLPILNEVFN